MRSIRSMLMVSSLFFAAPAVPAFAEEPAPAPAPGGDKDCKCDHGKDCGKDGSCVGEDCKSCPHHQDGKGCACDHGKGHHGHKGHKGHGAKKGAEEAAPAK